MAKKRCVFTIVADERICRALQGQPFPLFELEGLSDARVAADGLGPELEGELDIEDVIEDPDDRPFIWDLED